MKKMRRLIPAFAMLLVAATMLSTASFAWFTISSDATATGMTVSAKADSSLLIINATESTEEADNKHQDFLTASGVANFTTKGENLLPATHENGQNVNSSTGLVYISNADEVIDPSTGKVKTDVDEDGDPIYTATYAAAGRGYYIDYTVYLGTVTAAKEGALTATVTCDASKMGQIHNAIAIDFLVGSTEATVEYVVGATTWLDEAKAAGGDEVALGDVVIPVAVEISEDNNQAIATGDYLVVTMRVYFDGARESQDDTVATGTYVRDAYANDAEFGFEVEFHIEESN